MLKNRILKKVLIAAMLFSIAVPVFAEEAPVYDADNYPPQFDGQADSGSGSPSAEAPSRNSMPSSPSAPSQAEGRGAPDQSYSSPPLSTQQRIARLEQQLNNVQHSTSASKMEALQSEVQSLRGQVEELTHQLQQMQNQQKSMYTDLDKRINKASVAPSATTTAAMGDEAALDDTLSASKKKKLAAAKNKNADAKVKTDEATGDASASEVTASATTNQPNVAEEQKIYQTAYDLIKAKKYNDAIAALKGMLQKYPSGQFAANAHYWLGELYELQSKSDLSAKEFATIVSDYPDSPKVADAQLKLGLIYAGQLKWSDAKSTFKRIVSRYPGTASARLASEQLKQIRLAGH